MIENINYILKLEDLVKRDFETTWFEFKSNFFEPVKIGEYISALSNSATIVGSDYGFIFWGVDDQTHEIVGTTFDYNKEIKNESLEHYLLRNIHPKINFKFDEFMYKGKRMVVLVVPKAHQVPTSFNNVRYIRVGSSIESLLRYPEREADLWKHLDYIGDDIGQIESEHQELTFNVLLNYYISKGYFIDRKYFLGNLGLLNKQGKYNILTQLLSDNSGVSIRVAVFAGKDKSSPLYMVKEFGFMNLLSSLDKIIDYGETFNIPQANEVNRKLIREEVLLFDHNSYREAVINAFVHNDWSHYNAPIFIFYSDRIEITSNGPLSPRLTMEEFYGGKSEPKNRKLADIFMQLRISEKSGRGVRVIVDRYGKDVFKFTENSITVTIPFNFINVVDYQITPNNKTKIDKLNKTQLEIIKNIRNNPNITKKDLAYITKLGVNTIQRNLNILRDNDIIKRIGSSKNGYWQVNDELSSFNRSNTQDKDTQLLEYDLSQLNDTQLSILRAIKNNNKITIKELTIITNKGMTTIKRNIKELRDKEIIKRIGTDKDGYWEIMIKLDD